MFPFWSPDSRSIGFFAEQKLKRIDLSSKAVQELCAAPEERGATWGADVILFTPSCCDGLYQIPAAGGKATPLTTLNFSRAEISHRGPWFLPDGRHFLVTIDSGTPDVRGIYMASLDSKNMSRVSEMFSASQYTEQGYMIYVRQGALANLKRWRRSTSMETWRQGALLPFRGSQADERCCS